MKIMAKAKASEIIMAKIIIMKKRINIRSYRNRNISAVINISNGEKQAKIMAASNGVSRGISGINKSNESNQLAKMAASSAGQPAA
jgi:hypothetical protein